MAGNPALLDFIHLIRQSALSEAALRSSRLNHLPPSDPAAHRTSASDTAGDAATSTTSAHAGSATTAASGSEAPTAETEADPAAPGGAAMREQIDVDDLVALYHDEKARNDALQQQLHQRLDSLVQEEPTDLQRDAATSARSAKELELARLDWEIERLQQDLQHAPPPVPLPISSLTTRATLADLCAQYTSLVAQLHTQLATERTHLGSDTQLLADLHTVRAGLAQRFAHVDARLARESQRGSDETLAVLRRRQTYQQRRMREFLTELIEVTNGLFQDAARRKAMRHLLDALMNRGWDVPHDPYVQVTGNPIDPAAPRRNFDPALVEFVVRANIAVQHPRDARRIRLVAFGKPTRARV